MKLERITEQQIRDAIAKLQPDKCQYDYESVANCQRDADQKVVDELEHKLNMSKIEVKGLELTAKALEAKLPTKEEALAMLHKDNDCADCDDRPVTDCAECGSLCEAGFERLRAIVEGK